METTSHHAEEHTTSTFTIAGLAFRRLIYDCFLFDLGAIPAIEDQRLLPLDFAYSVADIVRGARAEFHSQVRAKATDHSPKRLKPENGMTNTDNEFGLCQTL